MRTASAGGSWRWLRNRRTLAYDAVSASAEKVDSGLSATEMNAFSTIGSYVSVLAPCAVDSDSPSPSSGLGEAKYFPFFNVGEPVAPGADDSTEPGEFAAPSDFGA